MSLNGCVCVNLPVRHSTVFATYDCVTVVQRQLTLRQIVRVHDARNNKQLTNSKRVDRQCGHVMQHFLFGSIFFNENFKNIFNFRLIHSNRSWVSGGAVLYPDSHVRATEHTD